MGKELEKLVVQFESAAVATFRYQGKPAWVARQIGQALGYSDNGSPLVSKISGDWASEFVEGKDFLRVTGPELSDLKTLLGLDTESVSGRAAAVLVLFEPGLHLTLTKTKKPAGRRLRRLLVDEVLPQLARDGRFDPNRSVSPEGELQAKPRRPALDREAQAVRRLEYRKLALQAANASLYAADHMADPQEAAAARREALRLLIGHPLKVAPAPAIPTAPEAPVPPPGPPGLLPVRSFADLERSRAARLAQEVNRQSPFGVQPPLPFSDDPTDPTKH